MSTGWQLAVLGVAVLASFAMGDAVGMAKSDRWWRYQFAKMANSYVRSLNRMARYNETSRDLIAQIERELDRKRRVEG